MESGSLADWFSAVGTIGAVVLSLSLTLKDSRKKLRVYVRKRNKFSESIKGITLVSNQREYVIWVVNDTNKFYQIRWGGIRFYENSLKNKIKFNILKKEKPIPHQDPSALFSDVEQEVLNVGQVSKEKVIAVDYINNSILKGEDKTGKIIEFIYIDTNSNEYIKTLKV